MCLAHVSLVTQECNIFSWNFLVMNLMSMSIIMSDCDVIGHIERARHSHPPGSLSSHG